MQLITIRGSYFEFNLNTGNVLSVYRWTPLPMPDQVIVRLNQIAAGDEVDDVDEEMVIPHLSEAEH